MSKLWTKIHWNRCVWVKLRKQLTLIQVMDMCHEAPNHNLNQCRPLCWFNVETLSYQYCALSFYSDLTLSQGFQPMAAQLSMKAALPLAKILATESCRSSKTRPRDSHCKDEMVMRPSYFDNGNSFTGKTASLYWNGSIMPYGITRPQWVNTLSLRRNEQHFADDIFKRIFFNENVWISIKISLKFVPKGPINNIPALVHIMAWRRSGDKPLSESMMVSLPTHICVTWPQWVKKSDMNSQGSVIFQS